MKDSNTTAKLLDLPYAPEAEAMLDELERSGQFRVGLEAEVEDLESGETTASSEYCWGRGSGNVSITDWWTSGRVNLRVNPGLMQNDVVLARVNDSLVIRTHDALDKAVLDGYLGLIPDASTLRIVFNDGSAWEGEELMKKVASWLTQTQRRPEPPNH